MKKSLLAGAVGMLVLSPLSVAPAQAGESTTCDASVVTIHKTDEADATPLAGAVFKVTTPEGVYLLPGDETEVAPAYHSAFSQAVEEASAFYETPQGQALQAAYITALGTEAPTYPADITGLTDPVVQARAMTEFQQDSTGLLGAFRDDVATRLTAMNAALTANPDLQAQAPGFFDYAIQEVAKMEVVNAAVATVSTTSDWGTFVNSFEKLTDTANWSYGFSTEPGVRYQDIITEPDFGLGNEAAAAEVGATTELEVTTGGDGKATFTLLGVKEAYIKGDTRGDLTCDHLNVSLVEVEAPEGYQLVGTEYSVESAADGTGFLEVTNSKVGVTPAPEPEPTPTPAPEPSPAPTAPATPAPGVTPAPAPKEAPAAPNRVNSGEGQDSLNAGLLTAGGLLLLGGGALAGRALFKRGDEEDA